ncbi:hypothetical protein KIN20_031489 [Parelaphostrongylus tenuis]|uniref:Uncharacterized protein n=1 Tax=Parelaphostrongylus tenuis TaxID=148309 RepID=A0AAD5R6S0_PARTN|nr:hypothetical protein KIN20_031489 [Parelaphostrongylus tenuis]
MASGMSCTAFTYAVTAGAAGASGAISSKFAFGELAASSQYEMFALSVFVFVMSNVLMWWAYTKSLSLADSTIQCLAVNIGTNFTLTVRWIFRSQIDYYSNTWPLYIEERGSRAVAPLV